MGLVFLALNHSVRIVMKRTRTAVAVLVAAEFAVFGLANVPIMHAQSPRTSNTPSSLQSASVKLNRSGGPYFVQFPAGRFSATGVTTELLIELAYDVMGFQLSGAPSWVSSERYDIDAKIEDLSDESPISPEQRELQRRAVIQTLLAEKFKLKVSHEAKDLPVYALVVAKNGPKLTQAKTQRAPMMNLRTGRLTMTGAPLSKLARQLSRQLGRPVIDRTGYEGNYDLTLTWQPGTQAMKSNESEAPQTPTRYSSEPPIFAAIQEQLGLTLEAQRAAVAIIAIEHIEKPSEN